MQVAPTPVSLHADVSAILLKCLPAIEAVRVNRSSLELDLAASECSRSVVKQQCVTLLPRLHPFPDPLSSSCQILRADSGALQHHNPPIVPTPTQGAVADIQVLLRSRDSCCAKSIL